MDMKIDEIFKDATSPSFTDDELKRPQATMIQDIFEASMFLNKMTDDEKSMYLALLMVSIRVIKNKCSEIINNTQQPDKQDDEPQIFFE